MTTIKRTALLFVVAVGLGITAAYAAGREPWTPSGVADFAHHSNVTSAGGPATGRTPESKLFYTGDGRWWAVLGDASGGVSLFRLDGHAWQPQLTLPTADPWMKADTLFDEDGGILYVTLRDNKSLVSNPRENLLYKLSYDGTGFTVVNGFPARISTTGTEALTIARDTHGRLWTTYRVGSNIRVGYTSPGGTAFTFKTLASGVTSDDISAVTSFGTSIGVMWSDQNAKRMFFASRTDATDPDAGTRAGFGPAETAYGGGVGGCPATKACADDHINLKVAGGEVHAAIKTGLTLGPDPLIVVLRRGAAADWEAFTVTTAGAGNHTKPTLLLAPQLDEMYVFTVKGGVKVYQSDFPTPSFTAAPTKWTASQNTYPTSTKQVITPTTGTVLSSVKPGRNEYWHNEFLPAAP